ncbi:MAG: 1-acyl-sn-glycerol-3-phosphate acyltransferase [Lachnospiraceae bacterium]|nr:1-acyl-sn-glycerol-3-phosphate acyltransferase [Lachnospiraceae bacterium]
MIRFIIAVLFLTVYLTVSLLLQLIMLIVGIFSKRAKLMGSNAVVRFGFKALTLISGAKVTITGRENIPQDGAVLYVGNHNGFFDLIIGHPLCKAPTAIIAKEYFKKFPIFAWWMMLMRCVFIDRKDIRSNVRAIQQATELVKEGISVLIYPEGTRSKTGEMNPFKEGSFKIAKKTGCPVVPIGMTGTAAIFDDHKPWLKSGPVTVTIGKPIYMEELTEEQKKAMAPFVQGIIQEMLDNAVGK